jgi:hypothetical protein
MKNVTLQQIADYFGATVWNNSRVYLNHYGYKTNKAKATVYVYLDEAGAIQISCYVECPSQSFAWIKGQKASIVTRVEEALAEMMAELATEQVAADAAVETEADLIVEFISDYCTPEEFLPELDGTKRTAHKFDRAKRYEIRGNCIHIWGASTTLDFQISKALDPGVDIELHVARSLENKFREEMHAIKADGRRQQMASL